MFGDQLVFFFFQKGMLGISFEQSLFYPNQNHTKKGSSRNWNPFKKTHGVINRAFTMPRCFGSGASGRARMIRWRLQEHSRRVSTLLIGNTPCREGL